MWWVDSFMSKKAKLVYLFVSLALATCFEPVSAVQVDDLYVAEVLVTSQAQSEFTDAARQGLQRVLVRISGNSTVDQNAAVRKALNKPMDYVDQFSHESTDRTFQIGEETIPAQILKIKFEPSSVARLLRSAEYPVWGNNRPSVLVWQVVETETGRMILSETDRNEVATTLQEEARRRGVPLMFPLLDLQDGAQISVAKVWGLFRNEIDAASSRYRTDSILSGRIYRQDGAWMGRWTWKVDDKWVSFDSLQIHLSELVGELIDRLADELAARYAIDSSQGHVWLRVEAVDDVGDYVRLGRYLADLAPVLDVYVEEVSDSEILYRLSTEGRVEQLVELIKLDEKLFLLASDDARDSKLLHFRWLQ
jgi:hypothetical protein